MKDRFTRYIITAGCSLFSASPVMATVTDTAYFVSPRGNDAADGSIKKPFLTLERARTAIRQSAVKKVYLRTGAYKRNTSFILTSEDSGSTWSGHPADAPNSAVIDGQGVNDVLLIMGGSNITINGLTVKNYTSRGIGVHGGKGWRNAAPHFSESVDAAKHNIIRNNIVENGKISAPGWDRAGINTQGATPHTQILHNVVRNTTGYGIGVWALQETDDISGTLLQGNVVLNTCTGAKDGAAVYICDRTAASTNIVVEDNFIRDYGAYENELRGIYLDDWASNITVRANIIAGTGTQPLLIHGGSNNVVEGNIIDLGNSGKPCVLNYAAHKKRPMEENRFRGNIVLSSYPEDISGGAFRKFGNVSCPDISHNLYFSYSTGVVNTGGLLYMLKDSYPLTANPHISDWEYTVDSNSIIYNAPLSFRPLKRAWGPPGYRIPRNGTPPSCLTPGTDAVYLHAESCDSLYGISKNGIAVLAGGDSATAQMLDNIHLGNGFDRMPSMAISSCDNGDWVCFNNVTIKKGFTTFAARAAVTSRGGQPQVEVRVGSPTGRRVALLQLGYTGGYASFREQTAALQLEEGTHRLYIIFKGGAGIGSFDYFKFY
ncbi:carbohydrate-binding protein [Chitinophaga sp.]|uniref:carbohydrate-binding protein n=1 Tax=Chitinophaga sp. TaxID=1869181 RepID=UPI0031DF75AC